jgi:hypothetical protein
MGIENPGEPKRLDVKTVRAQLGISSENPSDVAQIPSSEVPRTADGKVDLDALREMVTQKAGSGKIEVTADGKIVLNGEEIGEVQKETI